MTVYPYNRDIGIDRFFLEEAMKVTVFSINTTDGKRYGLKNANTGDVLHSCTAKYKTANGAQNFARKHGWELV